MGPITGSSVLFYFFSPNINFSRFAFLKLHLNWLCRLLLSISTKINLLMFVSFLGFPEFQFCLINLTFNVHVYVLPSNTVLMFALNKTDLVFSQCLYNAIWVWSFSEKKILMFVNDTLETTIRKKKENWLLTKLACRCLIVNTI